MNMPDQSYPWVTVKQAFQYAKHLLKSEDWAKVVLRAALVDGSVPARAQALLKEYALGDVRPLLKRRKRDEISLMERSDIAALAIDPSYLKPEPTGARLLINWNSNRITWVEPPPTKTFFHRPTGLRGVVMGSRAVMYGVELERSFVEKVVRKEAANQGRAAALEAKPPRPYRRRRDWRKLLSHIYSIAERGGLETSYGPSYITGFQADIERSIKAIVEEPVSTSTARELAKEIIEIDEAARSRKINQKLTITN